MSTAELVPDLRPPCLAQEDLDEEGVLSVGRDHDLLDVGVGGALVTAAGGRAVVRTWLQGVVGGMRGLT